MARRVGLRQPSLYAYIDSKAALYDAMFAQAANRLLEHVRDRSYSTHPRETVREACQALYEFVPENFEAGLFGSCPVPSSWEVSTKGVDRRPLLGAVTVLMLGLVACGGPEPPVVDCALVPHLSSEPVSVADKQSVLGIMRSADGSGYAMLARRDPLSLRPVSSQLSIPEYHDASAWSPNGSLIALSMSDSGREGRVGVLVVDLDSMKVVQRIETGIAADALAWLVPRALVAALPRGGTVLIDPKTGMIVDRWPEFSSPDVSVHAKSVLVMLAGPGVDSGDATAARLAVVDARSGLRSVPLDRIVLRTRTANGTEYRDRAGLAVDPERQRAFVVAAGAPIAEVDLQSLEVIYHPALESSLRSSADVLVQQRYATWLGAGQMLVYGRDFRMPRGDRSDPVPTAAGATLVDTVAGKSCTVDPEAGGAVAGPGMLLVFAADARPGIGLRAYTAPGQQAFHLFGEEQVSDVQVAGRRAYVQSPNMIRVIDIQTREILSTIPSEIADVIEPPS